MSWRELTAEELAEGARAYEELQARSAPLWERVSRVGMERMLARQEREYEMARWEDDGGRVGELPPTARDEVLAMVRTLGRRFGN